MVAADWRQSVKVLPGRRVDEAVYQVDWWQAGCTTAWLWLDRWFGRQREVTRWNSRHIFRWRSGIPSAESRCVCRQCGFPVSWPCHLSFWMTRHLQGSDGSWKVLKFIFWFCQALKSSELGLRCWKSHEKGAEKVTKSHEIIGMWSWKSMPLMKYFFLSCNLCEVEKLSIVLAPLIGTGSLTSMVFLLTEKSW